MRLQVSVEEAVGRRNGGLFSTLAKAARAAARAEGALLLAGGGAVIPGRNNLEVHMPRQIHSMASQTAAYQAAASEGWLAPRGVAGTLVSIVRVEGLAALYSGIVPGLQRQMAFSGIRIGAYEPVKQFYMEKSGQTSGLGLMGCRISAGITTGTLAILTAQPTDVVKIRMQAAGRKGTYKGVWDAYKTIARKEGLKNGLYRGTMPNIGRNCIINVAETVVYDSVKEGFISSGHFVDGFKCHLASAAVAGVTATLVASPVDVIKTRFVDNVFSPYSLVDLTF